MSPGTEPPAIYTIEMRKPSSWKGPGWPGKQKRPIPVTASICLDFASSSSFTPLESRPALILAPAKTWHPAVGEAMWEQAKARAAETGATVVWCDGGHGGLSGIADGARTSEVVQAGPGSWSRPVGIPFPFDADARTFYERHGQRAALGAVWAVAGVGVVVDIAVRTAVTRRLGGAAAAAGVAGAASVRGAVDALLRRLGVRRDAAPAQGNLLDVD